MKDYQWRTINSGYVYVDSSTGDDLGGDGTMQNPYKTLGKAYRGKGTKPGTIVCRGRFCEDMADGNHSCKIMGDYMGAATFDGENAFMLYGFGHQNMIIENCAEATYDLVVHTGSWLLAGVGRAFDAGNVGIGDAAYGVAGSSAIVGKSPMYMGCIGGNTAVSYLGVWKPKQSGTTKIWYGGDSSPLQHVTVYDVPIAMRGRAAENARQRFTASIFAKCDFFADEPLKFEECLFGADCKWYFNGEALDQEGTSGEERLRVLLGEMDALGIAEGKRPTFTNCIFSSQTSEELFNNAEEGDLTLKPTSEAVRADRRYYGALAPALNIPIMENSAGKAGTWDEGTANGILKVSGGAICLDETSKDTAGEIVSKVVKIDTARMSITAVLTRYGSKWGTHGVHLSEDAVMGAVKMPGDTLTPGRYMAKGDIIYKNTNYPDGSVVGVQDDGTTFMSDATVETSQLVELTNPNILDVCYVRSTPAIFAMVKSTDSLQRGGIYYNFGNKAITYRGKSVAPGESFVAANSTDKFTPPAGESAYQVGVMFDDTRVPSQEWIPAQFFGEYFVYKVNGVVQLDGNGVPISSGNPAAYSPQSQGGYSDVLRKSVMSERYCQFKIVASKQ